ncbi:MAG: hypothetical protein A2139_07820 [Desulfobacca sp. RBG_16_60_12]|nr:MAG: hypothetical protein A2139_07820 [Desulfobacca sp. RBG_16_60_12]
MSEFKLIVAGGRDFQDYPALCLAIDSLWAHHIPGQQPSIVCGKARGADMLGYRYAVERGLAVHEFPADWDTHGKKAGHLRNHEMAVFADGLLAFWDKESRGTRDMIATMKRLGKKTKTIYY